METMELLEKYFDVAFAAPAGVKRLRELILSLAMQGKLVPQDPSDVPAGELLKEIEAEKKRLVKEGKIKKYEKLPEVKPDEIPYEIPESWKWVRLGDLIYYSISGGTPSKNNPNFWEGNIPWASVKDLNVDVYLEQTIDSITEEGLKNSSSNIVPKNNIIVCTRMGLGKIVINKMDVAINQDLRGLIISPFIDQIFFFQKYKSYRIQGTGVTVKGIRLEELLSFLFPLPPLAEQRRIVEKIDSLMCRCDELEKLQTERNQKRLIVHAAAKDRLLSAKDNTEFSSAWEFIYNHFGDLYSVKENVSELRKVILQLAVMGKLVPQDPNDVPASELLKQIEAEKQRLIKEGKIKKQKPLPEIKPDEIPYEIPKSWECVYLERVVTILGDGLHGTPTYDDLGEYFFVNGNNLSDGLIKIKENTKKVSTNEYLKYKKELNKNTVLVSINGTIGNVAFYNFEKVILGKSVCYFNLFPNIDKHYIKKLINSEYFLQYALTSATGSTIKNVSLKAMRQFIVPLPPLQEQKRIVAKVDQLMALCDQLEEKIEQTTGTQTTLLNAVMANL